MSLPRNRALVSLPAWWPLVPLMVAVVAVLWLFRGTGAAMVEIWVRSDTFTHAFLVPPIALWLMWRQRAALSDVSLSPAPWWLLPMAALCLLWLLGELIAVNAATQLALVALVVMAVPVVLGWALAKRLAFPLLFLLFAVPLGEFLVEPMMEWTADFTVAALRLSGIPVYREGLQFVIPSGNWSVVQACSGVRYLIASVMVGTLFAHLNYRSRARQLIFVGVAIAVPIVANWLRAYMIVMLGHLSGNKIAAGVDHLIYGWLFFGIVIALMFVVGARFSDAPADATANPTRPAAKTALAPYAPGTVWAAAGSVVMLALGTQLFHARLDQPLARPSPQLDLPADLSGGWLTSDRPLTEWVPAWRNPNVTASRTYRHGDDTVSVWVGYYRDQDRERKLVSSTNGYVAAGSNAWLPIPQPPRAVSIAGTSAVMRSALLRTPADPKARPEQQLRVLQVYRVAGRFVAGDTETRLRLATERLLGRPDDGAVIILQVEAGESSRGPDVLEAFAAAHLPTLAAAIDAAALAAVPEVANPPNPPAGPASAP